MNLDKHPINVFRSTLSSLCHLSNAWVTTRHYKRPDELESAEENPFEFTETPAVYLTNRAEDVLTPERFQVAVGKARELGEDISISNKVSFDSGLELFIPMMDFQVQAVEHTNSFNYSGAVTPTELLKDITRALPEYDPRNFHLYFSGRSYHLYMSMLVPLEVRNNILGSLLMLNMKDRGWVVDSRWVGRSLKRGVEYLRWTANHPEYLKVPTLAQSFPLNF